MMAWHRTRTIITSAATAVLVGLSLAAVFALSQGSKFLSVQSGSMVPAISKGDLVIVSSVPGNHYRAGDVVTFISPQHNNQTVTHRVQAKLPQESGQPQGYVTKGDANAAADEPVTARQIIGKVRLTIPLLGYLFDFVRQPAGLLALVYLPALTIVYGETRRLVRHYKTQEPYVAAGHDPQRTTRSRRPAVPTGGKHAAMASTALVVAATAAVAPAVHAALLSQATLTGSQLQTYRPADHLVIQQVLFGAPGSNAAASGSSHTSATIDASNNNPQHAASGNASGANARSGDATNSSHSSFTINVGQTSGYDNAQTIVLYNPTNRPVSLSGWRLDGPAASQQLPNQTLASRSSLAITWLGHQRLAAPAGHLTLLQGQTIIDAISWGNDTSRLNPPIATTAASNGLARLAPGLDSDTASDWQNP